ncbi:MAG: caspase family protein [Gammaproteobacteria bacterium]|nr:caspase family protein [Gammaproteobacteria bacterium]
MENKHRAVLVGIPCYDNKDWNLPVIANDIQRLQTVLEKSDYAVEPHCPKSPDTIACGRLRKIFTGACRNAAAGETLLLYFSGHGGHYQGADYLVPADATLDDPESVKEYLLPLDFIKTAVSKSKAQTILFIVDACREGMALKPAAETKSLFELGAWTKEQEKLAADRSLIFMFSCGIGQRAQYAAEKEHSLFTLALSEVLDPACPARSLKEVKQAAQEKLDALLQELDKTPQEIRLLGERLEQHDPIICRSEQAIQKAELEAHPWLNAALHSPIWPAGETLTTEFSQAVRHIISACIERQAQADKALPDDPWRDAKQTARTGVGLFAFAA